MYSDTTAEPYSTAPGGWCTSKETKEVRVMMAAAHRWGGGSLAEATNPWQDPRIVTLSKATRVTRWRISGKFPYNRRHGQARQRTAQQPDLSRPGLESAGERLNVRHHSCTAACQDQPFPTRSEEGEGQCVILDDSPSASGPRPWSW